MSIDIKYDRDRNILSIILHDLISMDEFAGIMDTITKSDEHPSDVPTIWDLRSIDAREADTSLIEELIGIRGRYPERGMAKLALVTSSELAFGLSRMYEALSVDLQQSIREFRDRTEAEQWLEQ
jgi:hypothetical protein